jgi:hypothetical protein
MNPTDPTRAMPPLQPHMTATPRPGQPRPDALANGGARKKKAAVRPTVARKRKVSGPHRAYVAMWAGLAGLSMAYVGVLTVSPDVLTAMGAPMIAPDSGTDSSQGQRYAAKLASDMAALKQTVAALQGEVTALRSTGPLVVRANARADVRAPDNRAIDAEPVEPKLQGRLTMPDGSTPPPGNRLDGTRVAGMVITTTIPGPATPMVATPAAAPPVLTGPFGLELVVGPSVDALRLNWTLLGDRHGAPLKSLEPRYTAASQTGPYQLLAGPVATVDDGWRLCEIFRAKGTPCKVSQFQGHGF